MAGAVPKGKDQDLIDRINALSRQKSADGRIDDWAWRALKRDAESFARIPEFEGRGLLLLAVIWGMGANPNEMDRCLNLYAGKYGKDWAWYRARAQQGPSFGRLNTVIDMLKFGYPKGDLPNAYFVARVCNQAGLFQTTADTLEAATRLGGMCNEDELKYYAHLPSVVRYMNENSVDEREIAKRIERASQVVIQMSGPLTSFEVYGNESGITFEYNVDADIERLVDMDLAISEALASDFEDTYSSHISIGVTSLAESNISAR